MNIQCVTRAKNKYFENTHTQIPQKGKILPSIPNNQMYNLFQTRYFPGSHFIIYSIVVVKGLSSSVLKHTVTRYRTRHQQLFSFSTLKILQCFLVSTVSTEMSAINLTVTPLKVIFFSRLLQDFLFSLSFQGSGVADLL